MREYAGEEMKMLFNLQLREEMELYNAERILEERGYMEE